MTYTARELRLDDEEDDKKQAEPNAFLEEALFKARTILLHQSSPGHFTTMQ